MELELNKHDVYDFMDVREYLGCDEYDRFFMWLSVIHKRDGKQVCPFGVKPELLEEYEESLEKIKE